LIGKGSRINDASAMENLIGLWIEIIRDFQEIDAVLKDVRHQNDRMAITGYNGAALTQAIGRCIKDSALRFDAAKIDNATCVELNPTLIEETEKLW